MQCSKCGYCPTCGRSNEFTYYPNSPGWPLSPSPWCNVTEFNSTFSTKNCNQIQVINEEKIIF